MVSGRQCRYFPRPTPMRQIPPASPMGPPGPPLAPPRPLFSGPVFGQFSSPPLGPLFAQKGTPKGAQNGPKVLPGAKISICRVHCGAQCRYTLFLGKTTLGRSRAHFSPSSPHSRQWCVSACRSIFLSKTRCFVTCAHVFTFLGPEA